MMKFANRRLVDLLELRRTGRLSSEEFIRRLGLLLADGDVSPQQFRQALSEVDADADESREMEEFTHRWPSVIAIPLADYLSQNNSRLKLWLACDLAELLLRFVSLLQIGILQGSIGVPASPLPVKLIKRVRGTIIRPTFGSWKNLAINLVQFPIKSEPQPLPELKDFTTRLAGVIGTGSLPEGEAFLGLRNTLAHGGSFSTRLADDLVRAWEPRVRDLMLAADWLSEVDLLVRRANGTAGLLTGCDAAFIPIGTDEIWPEAAGGDDCVLFRRRGVDGVFPAWPLVRFASPKVRREPSEANPPPVPQVFVRRDDLLRYTALGSEAAALDDGNVSGLTAFDRLFDLEAERQREAGKAGVVQRAQQMEEMQAEADEIVGRVKERAKLLEAATATRTGVLWVTGAPGVGKSALLAALATQLELASLSERGTTHATVERWCVLPYRLRAGDATCHREPLLTYLAYHLGSWMGPQRSGAVDARLAEHFGADWRDLAPSELALAKWEELLVRVAPDEHLFLLVDGLDELVRGDPGFSDEVLPKLTGEGIMLIAAGRSEGDLPATMNRLGAVTPLGDNPEMQDRDLRVMLVERAGPRAREIIAQDVEGQDGAANRFVEQVVANAKGLPIYIQLVASDIEDGWLKALGGQLPPSVDDYHEQLITRHGLDDVVALKPHVAAILAMAWEPLPFDILRDLVHPNFDLSGESGEQLLRTALSDLRPMLAQRWSVAAGAPGYDLYHGTLRDKFLRTPRLNKIRGMALRRALGPAALDPRGSLAAGYLYRHGIKDVLRLAEYAEAGGTVEIGVHPAVRRIVPVEAARDLLCDFGYLMRRLQMLAAIDLAGVQGIEEDWRAIERVNGITEMAPATWRRFWRRNLHVLRRGCENWPCYKLLLQLAWEHAEDSPVSCACEVWLAVPGNCTWAWWRTINRPYHTHEDPCIAVFEGHSSGVGGALELKDRRLLSWSSDGLRLWTPDGQLVSVLHGHTEWVCGALQLHDQRILSWSGDNTLRLWTSDGEIERVLEGHTEIVGGALKLEDNRLLSWSDDGSLRLWASDGGFLGILESESKKVKGAIELQDKRLLSWSDKATLQLWTASGHPINELLGHTKSVNGALQLQDNRLISWSDDGTLRLWSEHGRPLSILCNHSWMVAGALELKSRRLLSWGSKGLLYTTDGQLVSDLENYCRDGVWGALELQDERLLSWSDEILRLWTAEGQPICSLQGHTDRVLGALELSNKRLISWSSDCTLRLWTMDGQPIGALRGHGEGVNGALEAQSKSLLSWSGDGTLRLWKHDTVQSSKKGLGKSENKLDEHKSSVRGALELQDGRLLSWSGDRTLRIWTAEGRTLGVLDGHRKMVSGAIELHDQRLLSWSEAEKTLRIWSAVGRPLAVLKGHDHKVCGALELQDKRLLSFSDVTGELRLWTAAGELISSLHIDGLDGMVKLQDGRLLSWSDDGTLGLWTAECCPLAVLKGHTDRVRGVLELKDGRLLSWSCDCTLRLWTADGRLLRVMVGHANWITGALELQNHRLLSWCWWFNDKTLRVWAKDGQPVGIFNGRGSWVRTLQLRDGRLLCWAVERILLFGGVGGEASFLLLTDVRDILQTRTEDIVFCLGNGKLVVLREISGATSAANNDSPPDKPFANVNMTDHDGYTAVLSASLKGHGKLVARLLRGGAVLPLGIDAVRLGLLTEPECFPKEQQIRDLIRSNLVLDNRPWLDDSPSSGEWENVCGADAVDWLMKLTEGWKNIDERDLGPLYNCTRLRRRAVSFLPKCNWVQAEVALSGRQEYGIINFLYRDDRCILLDLTNRAIYQLSERGALRLNTVESVIDYTAFFFTIVRGPHGRFVPVLSIDDIPFVASAPDNKWKAVLEHLSGWKCVFVEGAGAQVSTTLLFKDSLFKAKVSVDENGMVTITNEEELAAGLPVRQEVFDMALRYWAT